MDVKETTRIYQSILDIIQGSDSIKSVTALSMALGGAIAAASLTPETPIAIVLSEYDRAKAIFDEVIKELPANPKPNNGESN